jgi:hypothetical protein
MELIQIERARFMLGEKEYDIPAAGLARSEQWRAKFEQEIQGVLVELKEQAGALAGLGSLQELAGMDVAQLLPVVGALFTRLNVTLNRLAGLITAYHPDLAADEVTILEQATTKQAIVAVVEMAKIEYPFGLVMNLIPARNGREEPTTSQNLPSPSSDLSTEKSKNSTG